MLFLTIFFSIIIALELVAIVLLCLAFMKVHQWERQLFHLKLVFPKHMKTLKQLVRSAKAGENVLHLLEWPKLPFMLEVAQWTLLTLLPGGLFSRLRGAKR
jgi:hypothetical protein